MGSAAAPGGCVCIWPENLWSGHRGPLIFLHCAGGYSWGYLQALPINGEQLKGICLMTVEQRGCSVWAFLPTLLFFFKVFFFWCGPFSFFKVLLNLLHYCFCFKFWIFGLKACEVSAPQAELEIVPLALEENLTTGPAKSLCQLWLVSVFWFLFVCLFSRLCEGRESSGQAWNYSCWPMNDFSCGVQGWWCIHTLNS